MSALHFGNPRLTLGEKGTPITFGKGGWWRSEAHKLDSVSPSLFLDFNPQRFVIGGKHSDLATALNVSNNSTIRTEINADMTITKAAANAMRITHKNGYPQALLEGTATGAQGAETNPRIWYADGGAGRTNYATEFGDLVNGVRISSAGAFWHRYSRQCIPAASAGQKFSMQAIIKPGTSNKFYLGLYSVTASKSAGVTSDGTDWLNPIAQDEYAGAITNLRSIALADGVYLVSFTFAFADAAAAGGWNFGIGPGSDTAGEDVIVYAMQVEAGYEPTSLIYNDGDGQVTRTADRCQLHASASGITAWAFRGHIPARVEDWQALIGVVGNTLFSGDNSNPAKVGMFGNTDSSGVILDPACIPGSVAFCGGFGPSGRRLAIAGGVAGADAKTVNRDLSTMYIGSTEYGLPPGAAIYLDELVGWVLPDRPSAAGVQAQARAAT